MSTPIFRYKSGHPIPSQVIRALLFTGKTGFISYETWKSCFGVGTDRWKKMQLNYLIKERYFMGHRNPVTRNNYILGFRGSEILNELNASIVTPPPVGHLIHDSVVAKTMQILAAENLLCTWNTERELKRDGVKEYLVSNNDQTLKYPDAVLKINAFGKERTVAFEYERERKALSHYKAILWQYAGLTNLSMVLFVYERPNTKTTIQAAMRHLGQTALTDRLAFADAAEWKIDPITASIQLKSGTIQLGKVYAKSTSFALPKMKSI